MNSSKVVTSLAGGALVLVAMSGCFISTEPSPGPGSRPGPGAGAGTGTVTLTWTVDGSRNGAACSRFRADDLDLVVRDRAGRPVTTETAPCSDFTITVPLPPGDYTAEATLVDRRWRPVTTTLPLRDVRITSGTDLTIDIDFTTTSRL